MQQFYVAALNKVQKIVDLDWIQITTEIWSSLFLSVGE